MPSPLNTISPLIPVPPSNESPVPPPNKTDLNDILATLFAPLTPPASPLPNGSSSSSIFSHPPNPRPRVGSISAASSTDSDFGAFVSVPASEDPLAPPSSSGASPPRSPAAHRLSVSAGFFAEARAATARNQQGLLAELLEHEDDPMYWHEHAPSPSPSAAAVHSRTMTPQPPPPQPPPDSPLETLGALMEPIKKVVETTAVNPLLDALNEATSDNSFAQQPPSRVESVSVSPRRPSLPSPIARSPSLPPSPSRPSPPILTRVQSTSTFSSTTLPSRWMTSFLTYRGPPRSTSPPARLGPVRADITHGSPFAASPFVPASGAPGFGGDRAWNKGYDDDDEVGSTEQRGVQLLGLKEGTRVVLGAPLADIVRPNTFPWNSILY